uniref:Katanin p80 subunit C-terminal domain-containing protein n=1 Tax=Amphilophus citrinellus TaxID=61819 RepID=A0A3Q0RPW5_AMPCI
FFFIEIMDSHTEYTESQSAEDPLHCDAPQYRKCTPSRYPVSRSANNPGRVKRVVSCKRKTHHLTLARRKQLGSGRTCDAANKENETNAQQDIFNMDSWEFPLHVTNNHRTSRSESEEAEYCALTEVSKLTRDHNTMTDVLFGRNLRLKVALTLWQRNVGELLTYFLRCVPCSCIDEDSPKITIGCCVDLFPLVSKILRSPYEEHLIVGLKWIRSVLKHWWEDLKASSFSGSTNPLNFQVFNQQLWEFWQQEPFLKSVPGPAGDMAKVSVKIQNSDFNFFCFLTLYKNSATFDYN